MKALPYTTKSGLKIGSRYEPPRFNIMSDEDVHWQRVFLGLKTRPSALQVMVFGAYLALVIVIFAVLGALV